jgi:hypothetical protein
MVPSPELTIKNELTRSFRRPSEQWRMRVVFFVGMEDGGNMKKQRALWVCVSLAPLKKLPYFPPL